MNRNKYEAIVDSNKDIPLIRIQRDLNKTKIEAHHKLARSTLRIKKGIKNYQIQHQSTSFPSDSEQKASREVKGVLNIAHPIVIYLNMKQSFLQHLDY